MALTDELFEKVERSLADSAAHRRRLDDIELVLGEVAYLRSKVQTVSTLVTHFLVLELTSGELVEVADALRRVTASTEEVFRTITKIGDAK